MAPRTLTAALERWPWFPDDAERATLRDLQNGWSLARFGDGEFKSAYGREQQWQPASPGLAAELREVLWNPAPTCLVGIPTMNPRGPKVERWRRLEPKMLPLLRAPANPRYSEVSGVRYGSAFLGRPDHAPWIIGDKSFVDDLVSLWRGKLVAIVCCRATLSGKTLRAKRAAGRVIEIPCPETDAYAVIDELERRCLRARADGATLALLSCGIAATCLADRLARAGMQAIDVGTMAKRMLEPHDEKRKAV